MPSSAAVHDQLTRIIVSVVGCEPEAVVQSARLNKDLGVDSLSIIEVVEKLGLTCDVYIPDEGVNSMRTVQDAINAIVNHDPSVKGPLHPSSDLPAGLDSTIPTSTSRTGHQLSNEEIERRKKTAWKFARGFAGAGLAIGIVLGIGGAALVNASGLKDVNRPAVASPTKTETTASPKPSETPTAPTASDQPQPTLEAASTTISPGEKLRLTGAFPELGEGATIQVQVKDGDEPWDDFPVITRTAGGGSFTTVIFTTRTGERKFRMLDKNTNTATPEVTITIG